MIIEIKDLPEGRKVQRILVDITFEEDHKTTNPVAPEGFKDTSIEDQYVQSGSILDAPKVPVVDPERTERTERTEFTMPMIDASDRPKKDVPDEMLNLEF